MSCKPFMGGDGEVSSSVAYGDSFSLRVKSRLRRLPLRHRGLRAPGPLGGARLHPDCSFFCTRPHPAAVRSASRPRSAPQTSSPSPAPPEDAVGIVPCSTAQRPRQVEPFT